MGLIASLVFLKHLRKQAQVLGDIVTCANVPAPSDGAEFSATKAF